MCVFTCLRLLEHAHVTCIWRPGIGNLVFSFSFRTFFRQVLSLNMELIAVLARPAGQQTLGICFSVLPLLELQTFTYCFAQLSYMGIGDPKSGP